MLENITRSIGSATFLKLNFTHPFGIPSEIVLFFQIIKKDSVGYTAEDLEAHVRQEAFTTEIRVYTMKMQMLSRRSSAYCWFIQFRFLSKFRGGIFQAAVHTILSAGTYLSLQSAVNITCMVLPISNLFSSLSIQWVSGHRGKHQVVHSVPLSPLHILRVECFNCEFYYVCKLLQKVMIQQIVLELGKVFLLSFEFCLWGVIC